MAFVSRMRQLKWLPREPSLEELSAHATFGVATVADLADAETTILEAETVPRLSPLAQMLRDEGIPTLTVPKGEAAPSPLDEAVFTLQVASEVEHAFLLQYLYAAYSLNPSAGQPVSDAFADIIEVAKQEMAHLITVQNLLIALGKSVDLNRENFPEHPDLYPFPAAVEPLSMDSLAKYVTAESPTLDQILDPCDRKIAQAAAARAAEVIQTKVNQVGTIYMKLYWLFQDGDQPQGPWMLPADAIEEFVTKYGTGFHIKDNEFVSSATINNFAAIKGEWGGDPSVHVDPSYPRPSALAAIATITAQGEGPNGSSGIKSHFQIFLDLYRAFPQFPANAVKDIPVNPTAGPSHVASPAPLNAITDAITALWAQLLNMRYQILLLDIAIGMSLDRSKESGLRRTVLKTWAVGSEMAQFISPIAIGLTGKTRTSVGDRPLFAGAPFELDDEIPTPPCDRWKKQNTLIQKCAVTIGALRTSSGITADEKQLLDSMSAFDQGRQSVVDQKLKELCVSS